MSITVDSTVEEIKEYVENGDYYDMDWRDREPIDKVVVVALAKAGYSFDMMIGTTDIDDLAFECVNELSFKRDHEGGGRWSNFVTDYAKFDLGEEEYYVAMSWEQAATEYQENGTAKLYLVKPVEVTTVEYQRV